MVLLATTKFLCRSSSSYIKHSVRQSDLCTKVGTSTPVTALGTDLPIWPLPSRLHFQSHAMVVYTVS